LSRCDNFVRVQRTALVGDPAVLRQNLAALMKRE
jgi:hypothetical protein